MRFAFAFLCVALLLAFASPPTAMAFTTTDSVVERFDARQLAQRTGDPTGTTIDTDAVGVAIADASATMAPYVRGRYAGIDFGTAEPTLSTICEELAYIELAKRRPLGLTDAERADYSSLLRRLGEIADGRVALVLPDDAEAGAGSIDPASAWRSNPREFGRRAWTPPSA